MNVKMHIVDFYVMILTNVNAIFFKVEVQLFIIGLIKVMGMFENI